MRITLNAASFSPGKMGGTETYFRMLYKHLQEIDTENHYQVVCGADVAEQFTTQNPNFNVVTFPRYPTHSLRRYFFSFLRRCADVDYVRWSFKNLRTDVVHHPFSILFPTGLKFPSVLTFWDMQHEYYPEFFSQRELRRRNASYRSSCEAATRIICSTDFTRMSLIDRYGIDPKKIDVISVGYDSNYRIIEDLEHLEEIRSKYNLSRPFMYYPAAAWPHKNHSRLLKAMKILIDHYNFDGDLVLTGIAVNSHKTILRDIESFGLSNRVKILGYLPYTDLPGIYNLARILIFPSLFEGFGIPIVEAMACGCPVACSGTTSIPEVIGEAGVLFNPISIEEIVEQIWSIWSDENRLTAMRQKGLERSLLFNWETTARKTLGVYRKAINP